MSVVSYQHRSSTVSPHVTDYDETLSNTASFLQSFPWISSLIVCGSYAKGSLAPGWSDLDLVVVYDGVMTRERLDAIRLADGRRPAPKVPIGIDFVRSDTLLQRRRIVGRPLAMTIELAGYAQPIFGTNPFLTLAHTPEDQIRIEQESEILVRADANSWLRRSINGYASSFDELFDAAKSLLRIAMFESSPLPKSGITVSDYCDAVRRASNHQKTNAALTLAEDLRLNWPKICKQADCTEHTNPIAQVLVHYCEDWIPSWVSNKT